MGSVVFFFAVFLCMSLPQMKRKLSVRGLNRLFVCWPHCSWIFMLSRSHFCNRSSLAPTLSLSFAFQTIFHPLNSLFSLSSFLHLSFSPSPSPSLSCIPATFSVYQSRQAHYDFISQTTLAVPFSECWLGAGRRFLKILIMEHGKWLIIQQAMSHSQPD